jgi:hypothetical protein
MRRLTGTEKGALALAVFLVVGGVGMMVYPTEGLIPHPNQGHRGVRNGYPQKVTKNESRVYGGVAVAFGLTIGWMALYRGKNQK